MKTRRKENNRPSFNTKHFYFFNVKVFILNRYICKMYILANETVENQDLYLNKDDFCFKKKNIYIFLILNQKDCIFYSSRI